MCLQEFQIVCLKYEVRIHLQVIKYSIKNDSSTFISHQLVDLMFPISLCNPLETYVPLCVTQSIRAD